MLLQIPIPGADKWVLDQIGMVIILLGCLYFLGREYLKLKDKYDTLVERVINIATLWESKWSKDNDSDIESKKILNEIHELLKDILNNKKDVI